MLIRSSSNLRKAAFLAIVVAAVSFYCFQAYRQFAASRLAAKGEYDAVLHAIDLQPDNSQYWFLAGIYSLYNAQQPDRSIQQLTTAVRLNPWSSAGWLTLASAYLVTGDEQKQKWAVDSAVNADPKTPDVAWEAASFYLVSGDIEKSARLFRVVVENDPKRSEAALKTLWRARPDVDMLLNKATPPTPAGLFSLLNVLCANQQADAALVVWDRIRALAEPFPPDAAYPFIDFLIASRRPAQAADVWEQLADLNPAKVPHHGNNLILNSSFEDAASNGGFDWRYSQTSGVSINIDSASANTGTRSLAISFNGAPAEAGIEQFVPVEPGKHYLFSGSMSSDDIQSSSGPRFAVYDAYDGTRYVLSDDMLESNVWHRRNLSFSVGPNTHMLVVKIVREPSNPVIKGRAWIDDLQIVKE